MFLPDRLLIVGAHGQVGSELVRYPWPSDLYVATTSRDRLDIADPRAVTDTIADLRPRLIINVAAYTSVDGAEDDPERADAVNHLGVGYLAEAAASIRARLIHLSTDYVFDGDSPGWYGETDRPNPVGVYGRTKLAGEQAALSFPDALVLRTSWVYSANGTNFVKTMRRLARERDELSVVDDQRGCPTSAVELARAIAEAIQSGLGHTGLFHVAAPDDATWFELADETLRLAGLRDRVDLRPTTSDRYPTRAKRPVNSRLCSDRFAEAYRWRLAPWREALAAVSAELDRRAGTVDGPTDSRGLSQTADRAGS